VAALEAGWLFRSGNAPDIGYLTYFEQSGTICASILDRYGNTENIIIRL
jgi:hypothetical protein